MEVISRIFFWLERCFVGMHPIVTEKRRKNEYLPWAESEHIVLFLCLLFCFFTSRLIEECSKVGCFSFTTGPEFHPFMKNRNARMISAAVSVTGFSFVSFLAAWSATGPTNWREDTEITDYWALRYLEQSSSSQLYSSPPIPSLPAQFWASSEFSVWYSIFAQLHSPLHLLLEPPISLDLVVQRHMFLARSFLRLSLKAFFT